MPFGLTNAHATFQRALDNILSGLKWQICLVYLDDVIIFSSVAEQHVKDVDTVLSRGSVHGLSGSSHSFSHVESGSAEPLWCQQGAFFSKLQEEIAAGWLSVRGRRGGPTLGLPKRAFLAHLLRGLSSATMRWVLSTRRACADGSIVHGLEGKCDSPGLHAPTQPDSSEETVATTISTYIWGSKHSALPQLQQSSKSASTTPQRPIWNSFAIPGTCGHDPGLQGGRALAHGSTSGTSAGTTAASALRETYSHVAVAGGTWGGERGTAAATAAAAARWHLATPTEGAITLPCSARAHGVGRGRNGTRAGGCERPLGGGAPLTAPLDGIRSRPRAAALEAGAQVQSTSGYRVRVSL